MGDLGVLMLESVLFACRQEDIEFAMAEDVAEQFGFETHLSCCTSLIHVVFEGRPCLSFF
jgi:hypothetical protein